MNKEKSFMAIKQKSLFKKLAVSIMLLVVMVSSTAALSSYAYYDNNISYSFKIVANGKVSKFDNKEYRNTTDVNNAWKVNLLRSTESPNGYKTSTSFHLGVYNPNGINPYGSESYSVQMETGDHYFAAYANASKEYVYLYGNDSMSTNDAYSVSGYWDEETGKSPD